MGRNPVRTFTRYVHSDSVGIRTIISRSPAGQGSSPHGGLLLVLLEIIWPAGFYCCKQRNLGHTLILLLPRGLLLIEPAIRFPLLQLPLPLAPARAVCAVGANDALCAAGESTISRRLSVSKSLFTLPSGSGS